jgi:hypothetical protein
MNTLKRCTRSKTLISKTSAFLFLMLAVISRSWPNCETLCDREYPVGHDWVKLVRVKYFDFTNGQPRRALVMVDYETSAGSSSAFGILQVLELASEHPLVLQQIEYNAGGEGVGSSFDVKSGILKVKGVDGWEHCCPSSLDVGTFKWNGSRFVLLKTSSVPMPTVR